MVCCDLLLVSLQAIPIEWTSPMKRVAAGNYLLSWDLLAVPVGEPEKLPAQLSFFSEPVLLNTFEHFLIVSHQSVCSASLSCSSASQFCKPFFSICKPFMQTGFCKSVLQAVVC